MLEIMTSDASIKTILNSFPTKLSRSRLEPYAELILELHRRGRSYREIARILSEHCDIIASHSTLNDFVRSRLKRMRNQSKRRLHETGVQTRNSGFLQTISPPESRVENDEIQKRMTALKQRKKPTENNARRFVYDPDEPLSITPATCPETK